MQQHMKSGLEVATFLSSHPDVTNVIHPLLPSHHQHKIALDQHEGRHSGDFLQNQMRYTYTEIK